MDIWTVLEVLVVLGRITGPSRPHLGSAVLLLKLEGNLFVFWTIFRNFTVRNSQKSGLNQVVPDLNSWVDDIPTGNVQNKYLRVSLQLKPNQASGSSLAVSTVVVADYVPVSRP